MNDVVFISDLHLHPDNLAIQSRFNAFIEWARTSAKKIYILGDFFHVWVGDDAIDAWSRGIASQLYSLKTAGIKIYYMHGNRDFLLGSKFAQLAGWELLPDPTLLTLNGKTIMLAHGDAYCTLDKSHQWFRLLTRNRLFKRSFLSLALNLRKKLAGNLRSRSMRATKTKEQMDVVPATIVQQMQRRQAAILIHGHTHKPGRSQYQSEAQELIRYVLSDWDDTPQILSYNESMGFYFALI